MRLIAVLYLHLFNFIVRICTCNLEEMGDAFHYLFNYDYLKKERCKFLPYALILLMFLILRIIRINMCSLD